MVVFKPSFTAPLARPAPHGLPCPYLAPIAAGALPVCLVLRQRPNPSIEGTSTSKLRLLAAAPHFKR